MLRALLLAALAAFYVVPGYPGTCDYAYVAEGISPPAVAGVTVSDSGFIVRLWAWGENPSVSGSSQVGVTDVPGGLAVNPGFLWANAETCSEPIAGTALLVEAHTGSAGGRYAVVASAGAEGLLDRLQSGGQQSEAAAPPSLQISGFASGSDALGAFTDFMLTWSVPGGQAWAVSDIGPIIAGYRLHYRVGQPVDSGDLSQFSPVQATPSDTAPVLLDDPDTPDGFLPSTRTIATVRVRPLQGQHLALSLIFDGSGAAGPERQIDPSAVHGSVVGLSTEVTPDSSMIFSDGFENGGTSAWNG